MYQCWFRLNADSGWIILDEITKYIGATVAVATSADLNAECCCVKESSENGPKNMLSEFWLANVCAYIIHNIYIYIQSCSCMCIIYSVTVCNFSFYFIVTGNLCERRLQAMRIGHGHRSTVSRQRMMGILPCTKQFYEMGIVGFPS